MKKWRFLIGTSITFYMEESPDTPQENLDPKIQNLF